MPSNANQLDTVDIKILTALQVNARISNADLSELVNLSQTPCLRRLRKLERSGLIQQYSARLDQQELSREAKSGAKNDPHARDEYREQSRSSGSRAGNNRRQSQSGHPTTRLQCCERLCL